MSTHSPFELSEQKSAEHFFKRVYPAYRAKMNTVLFPRIAIVSGQPGAGKSVAIKVIKGRLGLDFEPLQIDTDELRLFHPYLGEIRTTDNLHMPDHTGVEADRWKGELLRRGRETKSNIIFEHTLRRKESVEKTIREFRESAYGVDLHCVAVNSKVSVQGVILRFADAELKDKNTGRIVPPSFHHEAYAAYPSNAQYFQDQRLVDTIAVYNRKEQLFENVQEDGHWVKSDRVEKVINNERNKLWLPEDKVELLQLWDKYLPHIEKAPHFPEDLLTESRVYAEEARLFLKASQATAQHNMLSGLVARITPHHVFVVSGQDLIAFNRSPLVKPDLVEGDEWLPKPYPTRAAGRKARPLTIDL